MLRPGLLSVAVCLGGLGIPSVLGAQQAQVVVVQTAIGQEEVDRLIEVLRIDDVVGVMRLEGLDYGTQMQQELFPGNGNASWSEIVALIYDPATMRKRFAAALQAELTPHPGALDATIRYFDTPVGQRILSLEVEARRSLLDPAVEDAAKARVEDMTAESDPRLDLLAEFARINDLTEANVSGALNANLAFFQGLAEVGALAEDMTEEQMLNDVWSQEAEIRAETEGWLYPYLALAYGPLSEAEMQGYLAFSASAEGQTLNVALFAAFDAVFTAISRDLGRAAARQMLGQDI